VPRSVILNQNGESNLSADFAQAHGDRDRILLTRAPMPLTAARRSGPIVVAHSETGHHHVVESPDAKLLTTLEPLVCYLQFEGPFVDVVHQRPFATHATLRLLGDAQPCLIALEAEQQLCCVRTPARRVVCSLKRCPAEG
jgi:hypothetical protein